MNKGEAIIGVLGSAIAAFTSCGNLDTVWRNRQFAADSRVISVDASQRMLISKHRPYIPGEPDIEVICAEPSPDVLTALANQSSVKGGYSNITVEAMFANAQTAATIGIRTTTIQGIRDDLFRLCEAYSNGAISQDIYTVLMERDQARLVGMVAIEDLTTAAQSQKGQITAATPGSSGSGPSNTTPSPSPSPKASPSPSPGASLTEKSSKSIPTGDERDNQTANPWLLKVSEILPISAALSPSPSASPKASPSPKARPKASPSPKAGPKASPSPKPSGSPTRGGTEASRTGATVTPELINGICRIVHDVAQVDEVRDFCLVALTAPPRTPIPYPVVTAPPGSLTPSDQARIAKQFEAARSGPYYAVPSLLSQQGEAPVPSPVPSPPAQTNSFDYNEYERTYYEQRIQTRSFCIEYLKYRMMNPLPDSSAACGVLPNNSLNGK